MQKIKNCPCCKKDKPLAKKYFSPAPKRSNGFSSWCRDCQNLNSKRWFKTSPKARKTRKEANFRKIGVDLDCEGYDNLAQSQENLCKICGKPECVKANSKYKKHIDLAVDHNHNTKKIRGLLCQKCNRALGLFNVDSFGTLNLQMAIKYMETE